MKEYTRYNISLTPEETAFLEAYVNNNEISDPAALGRIKIKLGTSGKYSKLQTVMTAAGRGELDPLKCADLEQVGRVGALSDDKVLILKTMTDNEGELCKPRDIQESLDGKLMNTVGVEFRKIYAALGIEEGKPEERQIRAGIAYLAYKKTSNGQRR